MTIAYKFALPLVAVAIGFAAPAAAQMSLEDLLGGGGPKGEQLEAMIEAASEHPLGSEKNPVRADMPQGQRAYLNQLRCADGTAPLYRRVGNLGAGAFGRIVDSYEVKCEGSAPSKTNIIMDMYHPGYQETQAVEGFTMEGDQGDAEDALVDQSPLRNDEQTDELEPDSETGTDDVQA